MSPPLPALSDTPPSDDAIVIDVTLTSDDLITFNVEGVGIHPSFLDATRTLKSSRSGVIKFALVMIAAAALWAWAGAPSPSFFSWMFSGFFAGVAIAFLVMLRLLNNSVKPATVRATAEKSAKSGRFGPNLGPVRYIIDQRGVETISTSMRSITGWSRIIGVSPMPSLITIDTDAANGYLIPRRAADAATLERLTQFVERMIANAPNSERERTLEALRAGDQTCPKCKQPLTNIREPKCPKCALPLNRATLSLPIRGVGEPRASAPSATPPTAPPTSPGAR